MAAAGSKVSAGKIAAIIGCLLVAAVAFYWANREAPAVPAPTHEWYYDLGSKQLFVVAKGQTPPVEAPSGFKQADGSEGGVRAYVYSCGTCGDTSSHFVAYLESYSPEAKKALTEMSSPQPGGRPQGALLAAVQGDGQFVASPETGQWTPIATPAGQDIVGSAQKQCQGKGAPERCFPPATKTQ